MAIAVIWLLPAAVSAAAEEQDLKARPTPYVSGDVAIEAQLDHAHGADPPSSRRTSFEGSMDADIAFRLMPALSVQSEFSLDSTDNRVSDENLRLGEVGLRIEELYLQIDVDNFRVFAGKFTVEFGVAWQDAFGLYGTDLAEEYEFMHRAGFGAEVVLDTPGASVHRLRGAAFLADTSVLSGDLISGRDRLRRSDGGIANTGTPSSFSLSLQGGGFELIHGLNYNASYHLQAAGRGDANDQHGVAFTLYGASELTGGLSLDWIGEFARLFHAEGGSDDRTYFTLSAQLGFDGVWLAPTLTHRHDTVANGADSDATLATISLGYDFDCGLSVSAGFQLFDGAGEKRELFGIKTEYVYEF